MTKELTSIGEDGVTRLPRPLGSTMMARTYNQSTEKLQRQKHKKTIINHTIRQYILQGHTLNGSTVSMVDLGLWLGLSVKKLFKVMGKQTQELSGITGNPDTIKDMLGLMGTLTIQNTLQTRAKVNGQVQRLLNAQGEGYKPFISGEANKALQLAINSDKSMADLMKVFMGPGAINIHAGDNVQGDKVEGDKEVEYLTVDRAINIVSEGHEPFGQDNIKTLDAEYIKPGFPEVRAVKQEGVDDGALVGLEASMAASESRSERRAQEKLGPSE